VAAMKKPEFLVRALLHRGPRGRDSLDLRSFFDYVKINAEYQHVSSDLDKLLARLESAAAGPAPGPTGRRASRFGGARAGPRGQGWLQPVRHVHRMPAVRPAGHRPANPQVEQNTRQFLEGQPANNVLLTGARVPGNRRS
jgi:predicted AAA+ superfamily ATPase